MSELPAQRPGFYPWQRRFAWLPTRINGRMIWLRTYFFALNYYDQRKTIRAV